jgi:versiconal hemiacetal acetate esterase
LLDQAWQAAEELGADQHKYFSAGGSAGGGLALSIAEKLIADGKAGHIQGIVALVPIILHYLNVPEEFKSMYKAYGENAEGVPIIDKDIMKTFFGKCPVKADLSR